MKAEIEYFFEKITKKEEVCVGSGEVVKSGEAKIRKTLHFSSLLHFFLRGGGLLTLMYGVMNAD